MNCKFLQKYAPQAENRFKVPFRNLMTFFDFNFSFQVTIEEVKTFIGGGGGSTLPYTTPTQDPQLQLRLFQDFFFFSL